MNEGLSGRTGISSSQHNRICKGPGARSTWCVTESQVVTGVEQGWGAMHQQEATEGVLV